MGNNARLYEKLTEEELQRLRRLVRTRDRVFRAALTVVEAEPKGLMALTAAVQLLSKALRDTVAHGLEPDGEPYDSGMW